MKNSTKSFTFICVLAIISLFICFNVIQPYIAKKNQFEEAYLLYEQGDFYSSYASLVDIADIKEAKELFRLSKKPLCVLAKWLQS